jgi:O-antigen biosynthesis protein
MTEDPRCASGGIRPARASIIVPTLGNPLLLRCLDSLRRHIGSVVPYEVVVVGNGVPNARLEPIRTLSWPALRLVPSPVNLGFVGGCNRGAAEGSGEYLVFLNDDTEVLPGWLEALVETADGHPQAAAVGSLILFPDGSIQEAGSIVWRDGSTLGVARGASIEASAYNFLRPVDYCSACSLLVRRECWDAVGGLDARYFPAYYEDVDLCFTLAQAGFRILLQPRSRLVHYETGSSSTPRKTFLLLRNRESFALKWADALQTREAAAPTDTRAVARAVERARGTPRLLLIDDRPPQRGCGAGFSVLLDAIEAIHGTGAAVSIAVSDRLDGDLEPLANRGVHVMRERPESALAFLEGLFGRVVISRPHNFARFAALVRRHQPQAVLVYLAEALFYRRMQRQLELVTDAGERERLTEEMLHYRELERAIPLQADHVICVSDEEAAILAAVEGHCPIETIRPVAPGVPPTSGGFAARTGLLFTPGWLAGDASPNTDALRWFVEAVLPRLLEHRSDIRLRVTGSDPPRAALALEGPAVSFVGFVPDLGPLYEAARIVVVPMRVGAGVKVKCLEAMQYGVPIVSTTVGAEGLGLQDTRAVVVTDAPEEFAASLLRLYESPHAWEQQRNHILRVVAQWRALPVRSWRQALTPTHGDRHYEPQFSGA